MVKIDFVRGSITDMDTDAIINAANAEMIHGGGLALHIAREGGEVINKESREIGFIGVGNAAVTGGGKLKARYVIHAATMSLKGQTKATAESIRNSFRRSLELAEEKGCKSIAVPAIGCGIAGFNTEKGAAMMREVIKEFKFRRIQRIVFVLYSEGAFRAFKRAFNSAD